MKRLLPAVVLLVVLNSSAYAAPVLFDNRAEFDAAVGAHALFTDFDLTHVPFTFDFEGDFRGLYLRKEVFELVMGATLGPNGIHTEGRSAGLFFQATTPITAIGFDLVSAWTQPFQGLPVGPPVPIDVGVGFATVSGGVQAAGRLAPGSFFGAILYDDAFSAFVIATSPTSSILQRSGFTIDNLAVQAVPEPSTMLLLSAGLMGLVMARQYRRR